MTRQHLEALRDLERARIAAGPKFVVKTDEGEIGFETEAELAAWSARNYGEAPEKPTAPTGQERARAKAARRQELKRRREFRAYILAYMELRTGKKPTESMFKNLTQQNIDHGIAEAARRHPQWAALRKHESEKRHAMNGEKQ